MKTGHLSNFCIVIFPVQSEHEFVKACNVEIYSIFYLLARSLQLVVGKDSMYWMTKWHRMNKIIRAIVAPVERWIFSMR